MRRHGFTLIEMMVVIAIIVLLSSMLLAVLPIAERESDKTRAKGMISKVDTALRLYRAEVGGYPYQQRYADLSLGDPFENTLFYHLGTSISTADLQRVRTDAETAAAKFNSGRIGGGAWTTANALSYQLADVPGSKSFNQSQANRVMAVRVRRGVMLGNLDMVGPIILDAGDNSLIADKSATPVLTSGERTSASRPGWAADYLHGDLKPEFVDGDAILDPWGKDLIYICQLCPGIQTGYTRLYGNEAIYRGLAEGLGTGPTGFAFDGGPVASIKAAGRYALLYQGRVPLSADDAGDGLPTPPDATFYPDAGDFMRSDIRYYAAPTYAREFELWSAGPDEDFAYMRDDPANEDNIAVMPYNEALDYE